MLALHIRLYLTFFNSHFLSYSPLSHWIYHHVLTSHHNIYFLVWCLVARDFEAQGILWEAQIIATPGLYVYTIQACSSSMWKDFGRCCSFCFILVYCIYEAEFIKVLLRLLKVTIWHPQATLIVDFVWASFSLTLALNISHIMWISGFLLFDGFVIFCTSRFYSRWWFMYI